MSNTIRTQVERMLAYAAGRWLRGSANSTPKVANSVSRDGVRNSKVGVESIAEPGSNSRMSLVTERNTKFRPLTRV
jgi:hypothetical protein